MHIMCERVWGTGQMQGRPDGTRTRIADGARPPNESKQQAWHESSRHTEAAQSNQQLSAAGRGGSGIRRACNWYMGASSGAGLKDGEGLRPPAGPTTS